MGSARRASADIRSLVVLPDITREPTVRIRDLMNAPVRDFLVSGYERIIPGLTHPDPDDRHVLAAAIHCEAQVIVTFNLKEFPTENLRPYGIEAQHSDGFLFDQLTSSQQRQSLKKPAMSVEAFLQSLERQRLPKTVAELRKCAEQI